MSSSKNHWIDIADMLQLQRQLLAEHQEWPPHTPENSSYHLLGAVEELASAFWRKHHTNLWRDYNAERTAWILAVHGEKEQSDDNHDPA